MHASSRSPAQAPVRLGAEEFLLDPGEAVDDDELRAVVLRLAGRLRALERGVSGPRPGEAVVERPESLLPRAPDPSTVEQARRLPLFDAFEGVAFDELVGGMREWRLPAGRMVFTQGAPAGSAYLLVRGRVEVWTRRAGKEYRLALGGPGTLLGEVGLLDRRPRTMSCRSRDATVLLELSVAAFVKLWGARSAGCRGFIQVVGRSVLGNLRRAEALTARAAARSILRTFVDDVPSSGGVPLGVLSTHLVRPAEDEARRRYEGEALMDTVARSVVGRGAVVEGPFGARRTLDVDPSSSGRGLRFIEDFLREEVLGAPPEHVAPLVDEARALLGRAVSAGPDDVVLFVPGGARAAIQRLVELFALTARADGAAVRVPEELRPVVFLGPYEGAANDLPWRGSVADVVFVGLDADGGVDLAALERDLIRFEARPLRIGSFSGGSDVTGVVTDDVAVTRLLHRHGATALWDYSSIGGRVALDMNPGPRDAAKDALVFSPRGFPGGAAAPAVLVVKRPLLALRRVPAPAAAARWVSPWSVVYEEGPPAEEGRDVDAVGAVRAGLVMQLREAIGVPRIRAREDAAVGRALDRWRANPNLWVLGRSGGDRLGYVALCVRREGRFLHWGFVVALLRDLFGIRVGGGVSGAGPYAHALLGVDVMTSWTFEEEGNAGFVGLSPGWFRVGFGYFLSEAELEYLIEAVDLVASEGWRLLPLYRFDPRSGAWTCVETAPATGIRLADVRYPGGVMHFESGRVRETDTRLGGYLAVAREVFSGAEELARGLPAVAVAGTSARFESVRWFTYPHEAREVLLGETLSEEATSRGLDPQELVRTEQ